MRGASRVALVYTNGTSSAVAYNIIPPLNEQVAAYGNHIITESWLPQNAPDPFGRSTSAMPFDREDKAL